MKLPEIRSGVAALMYYASPEAEKGVSFENLPEEKQAPFLSLAEGLLVSLDKMNLTVIPKKQVDAAGVNAILRDRIESEVKGFAGGLNKVHKPTGIPWEELVQRIFNMFQAL